MNNQCRVWLGSFLEQRKEQAPDSRELFRYRTTQDEYLQLQELLKQELMAVSADDNLERMVEEPLFCQLFVLYASEWWRRMYDGSGLAWDPILFKLQVDPGSWTPQQRSECVEKGLAAWGCRVRQQGGFRFILSIALQGGLPLQLVSRGRGGLGKLLKKVLQLAGDISVGQSGGNHAVGRQDIYLWVESLQGMLPKSYRQSAIYLLLTEMILTVIDLKQQAKLTKSEDALDRLDRNVPGWRDRFSLPLEDQHAQGLIAQLLQDAAEAHLARPSASPFILERSLEEEGQNWRLCSSLLLPDIVSSDQLASFFSVEPREFTPQMNLVLRAGAKKRSIKLRRITGHDERYRVMGQFADFLDDDAAKEHILDISLAQGRNCHATVYQGDELDSELPWIFSARSGSLFLRQGSGKIAETESLISLPEEWQPECTEDGLCTALGQCPVFSRKIWSIRGDVAVQGQEGSFRFRTGRADAKQTSFTWKGDRFWQDFHSPICAFRGMPVLWVVNDEGITNKVSGEPLFQTLGSKGLDCLLGPVMARYPATGEPQCRTRMVLLPEHAAVEIKGADACSGIIELQHWGMSQARTLSPGVELSLEKEKNLQRLHLSLAPETRTPEQIELELFWPHSTSPVRLSLPFPAKGARAFAMNGKEWRNGSCISLQQLLGARVIVHPAHYNAHVELILRNGTNAQRAFRIRRVEQDLQVAIRLQEYEEEIRLLLFTDDRQDSSVIMEVIVDGSQEFRLNVRSYDGRLKPDETRTQIILNDSLRQSLDALELSRIRLFACNMVEGCDYVEELEQHCDEEVPTGIWPFAPEKHSAGPWLLYPHPESTNIIRPIAMFVEGDFTGQTPLSRAMNMANERERLHSITDFIEELAADFFHEGWDDVEEWADRIGHLGLNSFDLWRAFARSSSGMAAATFRLGSLSWNFLRRFALELPFCWDAVRYQDWKQAMGNLRRQCEEQYENVVVETVFKAQLTHVVEQISTELPQLQYLLGIAKAAFFEEEKQTIAGLRLMVGPSAGEDLFAGDSCLQQQLFNRHAENEIWPVGLQQELWQARQDQQLSHYMCPVSYGFKDPVINLPLLLASQCATGTLINRFFKPELIRTLHVCRAFDPDWFNDAYNLTIARCLSDGLLEA